jgi:Domain of unknown function (DUF4396)
VLDRLVAPGASSRLGHSPRRKLGVVERATATDEGGIARDSGIGSPLDRLAFSATLHCLTGCAIGEVTGMTIATALGWGNLASIALAVGLAYAFGFGLTAMPLINGGLAIGAVISTAVAADTVSISIMEAIDNLFVAALPGALDAGIGDPLFWGSIAAGFAIAFPFAFLANRFMIARGKGCALAHPH